MLQRLGRRPAETTVAIQGFGNVGSHAGKLLHESEFKIVAISDISGGYYDEQGYWIEGYYDAGGNWIMANGTY